MPRPGRFRTAAVSVVPLLQSPAAVATLRPSSVALWVSAAAHQWEEDICGDIGFLELHVCGPRV